MKISQFAVAFIVIVSGCKTEVLKHRSSADQPVLNSPSEIKSIEIVEGDIIVAETSADGREFHFQLDSLQSWPKGLVPYVIDPSVTSAESAVIRLAIDRIHAQTAVRIVPRRAEADYVRFTRAPSSFDFCASAIGRTGGEQPVTISSSGCSASTIIHEIGHVLGLVHEHQRPDRDTWVYLDPGANGCKSDFQRSPFTRFPTSRVLTEYDYDSIMTYGGLCFDGRPFLRRRDNREIAGFQSLNLTTLDRRKFDLLAGLLPKDVDARQAQQLRRRRHFTDFNGDGFTDLGQIKTNRGITDVLALNSTRARSLIPATQLTYYAAPTGEKILYGDANNDGATDLLRVGPCAANSKATCIQVDSLNPDSPHSSTWAEQQGAWNSRQVWFSGDFDGNNRADLGKCWLERTNSLQCDVHLSEYDFAQRRLIYRQYRWFALNAPINSNTKLFSGDFNGDGKTDIAIMSVSSTGKNWVNSFYVATSKGRLASTANWAQAQGVHLPSMRYAAADFDGDGKTDIMRHWYDSSGAFKAELHRSTGTSFVLANNWFPSPLYELPSERLLVGDFNGDMKVDIAKVFPCGSRSCIYVLESNGSSLRPKLYSTNNTPFQTSVSWFVGDFNGDGRDDIARYWPEGTGISVEAQLSSGSAFQSVRMATRVGSSSRTANAVRHLPQSQGTSLPDVLNANSGVLPQLQ